MTWTPDNYRQSEAGYLVRHQVRIDAIERFTAMTEWIDSGEDQECIRFTGGDTFRVDEVTVTTPRRFIYEYLTGEILPDNVRLRMSCKTDKCIRLSHIKPIES